LTKDLEKKNSNKEKTNRQFRKNEPTVWIKEMGDLEKANRRFCEIFSRFFMSKLTVLKKKI